jgi:magnesium transporter
VLIEIFDYDNESFEEKTVATVHESFPYKDKQSVTWVNLDGVHNLPLMERLGAKFGLHPLILEDIVSTRQRPKLDVSEDHLFMALKMIRYDDSRHALDIEQVALVVGQNFVISFQEKPGDVFEPIRTRLREHKGKIREMGADYLAYALIDTIVDHYFIVMEEISYRIEILDEEVLKNPSPQSVQGIHALRKELIALKRSVWPLREVLSNLLREEHPIIQPTTLPYLRDVQDHTVQVIDMLESLRDVAAGLLDTYLSSISNRMNEVMKVLTIIATIFIPITFIAGIYGMNFDNMPELHWKWGYPMALAMMLSVACTMIVYFKRKNWL